MMNKSEIRGIKAGCFFSEDQTAIVKFSRSDDCVIVEIADIEADSTYKFDIPFNTEDGSIIPFKFTSLTEQRKSEQEL